jgi:two-component system response regulator ResD
VAEDEPHIRRILVTLLEESGFQVDVAPHGGEARRRLQSDVHFDLVLMDIMMPEATGLELLAEMRQLPHRRSTPVVILTAKGQDVDREEAFRLGAADFITKPFSPKKFLNRVDQILAQR